LPGAISHCAATAVAATDTHEWDVCVRGKHREQLLDRKENEGEEEKKTHEWIEPGTMRDRRPSLITTTFGQLIGVISWLLDVCRHSWSICLVGKCIDIAAGILLHEHRTP